MTLHVVGVRHHSPACARVVLHAIRTLKPRHVLIEGPADMNDRIGELLLPHKLPVALFTYFHGHDRTHSSWTPFCRHAPEWVALQEGHARGAQVRFIDLPAWDPAFGDVRNRYSDRQDRAAQYVSALCAKFGFDDSDTLWDHLFEQPMPVAELAERLKVYFESLRADDDAEQRDITREAFMARFIRWALADGGNVLVVCGGYHAPVLARVALDGPAGLPRLAKPPRVEEPQAGTRHGTYLVPYSFKRLDSFVGYERRPSTTRCGTIPKARPRNSSARPRCGSGRRSSRSRPRTSSPRSPSRAAWPGRAATPRCRGRTSSTASPERSSRTRSTRRFPGVIAARCIRRPIRCSSKWWRRSPAMRRAVSLTGHRARRCWPRCTNGWRRTA